jgi:rhodanese-related sulfurtransferase
MPELLIDVREFPEYAAGHIAGSQLVPLATLGRVSESWDPATPITLICRTDRRANLARQQLASQNFSNLTVLTGGIEAWRAAGKPLETTARQPWSLERQVRVAAGSLVLITLLLAHFVSPWFFFATGFVGAGLVFAGVSDICMMATLLGKLPWNRA